MADGNRSRLEVNRGAEGAQIQRICTAQPAATAPRTVHPMKLCIVCNQEAGSGSSKERGE